MSNKVNRVYQKHLTLLNREDIEKLLKLNFKFYQIADNIQKHPTTISKEILNNRIEHKPSCFNNNTNFCKHKTSCVLKTFAILIVILNANIAENAMKFAWIMSLTYV